MPLILLNDRVFVGLSSHTLLERQYEELIAQSHLAIFPSWKYVPFAADVRGETDTRRPDFALIDPFYREWWVGEVELSHHSFEGHVLPQIEAFWTGSYGPEHADYLARRDSTLDRSKLHLMMLGNQPGVLVIVDRVPAWIDSVEHTQARLGVVEVFRSDRNDFALRINGDIPRVQSEKATRCVREPSFPRAYRVEAPAILPDPPESQEYEVIVAGALTRWRRIDTATHVYLTPLRGEPIQGSVVKLAVDSAEGLVMTEQ